MSALSFPKIPSDLNWHDEVESLHRQGRCSRSFMDSGCLSSIYSSRAIGLKPRTCPSRISYPGVAMTESGQNWRDDDGSGRLDSSSYRRVFGQSLGACGSHCNKASITSTPGANAVHRRFSISLHISFALSAARIKTPRAGGAIRGLLRKGGAPHLPEEAEPDEARDVTVGLEAGFLFEAL